MREGSRAPTVLQIAHAFPPASGSGAIRALAFARYLPMYGWRSVVLTPGAAWAAPSDPRLLAEVPAWLEIVRTASLEPRPTQVGPPAPATTQRVGGGRHFGVRHGGSERHMQRQVPTEVSQRRGEAGVRRHTGGLKRHLGHLRRLPDAHVGWLPMAVAAGLPVARRADVLYSSSGPFTSHLVGLVLHRLTGRPWVVELRDGWYRWNRAIFPDYPAWRAPIEAQLESACIHAAARVVCVTERMANAFRCQYADQPAEHFGVVPNGFDPAQIELIGGGASPPREAGFEVLHAGALYYGRPIGPFLAAATRLVAKDAAFADHFRLRLIGTLDAAAEAEVAGSGLGDRVRRGGYLEHAATLVAERAADLLLLVANVTPGAEATVPGKLFEYLATGQPVLAVAPNSSATAEVLARTGGGWLADGSDVDAVYQRLLTAWEAYRRGTPPQVNAAELGRFDRRRLAGELARVFDEVAGR
jgi:glycosyltransferase involved in cell wall biosynthesis